MKMQTVLNHYQRIQKATAPQMEMRLPVIEQQLYTLICLEPCLVDNITAVYEHLHTFQATQGWLAFQSKNQSFTAGLPSQDSVSGLLLNAEMVNDQQHSLHIRYNGRSQWLINQYQYSMIETDSVDNNEHYIADKVKHFSVDHHLKSLNYLRFWHLDQDQGIEPFLACFTGFGA